MLAMQHTFKLFHACIFFYFTIKQQYDIISIFPIRFSLKFSNIYF